MCFTRFCYVRSSQCSSCWFQVSVFLAHGESCRIKLGDLGPTLQHQWFTSDHRAQLRPSLGFLGVSWLPSRMHMGILGPSCASLGSILGSPCAPLGPTWTILDLPGHPEAPLSSSWCVLGVDGESRGSILTPKTNFKTKLMSF